MTTCSTFATSIKKRVKAGKTLDNIADELCTDVKFNRAKVIRVIKEFLGEEYLIEHAKTLEYDVGMADLAKKKTHKNIDAPEHIESGTEELKPISNSITEEEPENPPKEPLNPKLLKSLEELIAIYTLEKIREAIEQLEN